VLNRKGKGDLAELKVAADLISRGYRIDGKVVRTKHYTAEMIDWLAVYDATTDKVFYVPAAELGLGMSELTLRFTPTLNGQVRRVRLAERYRAI
jgi:hypothetical protein